MGQCKLLQTCLFYNDRMTDMPADADIMKKMYCRNDNSDCARYVVYQALGRGSVPRDLSPAHLNKALEIIG